MQATTRRKHGLPTAKMDKFVIDLLTEIAQYDRPKALEIWESNKQRVLLSDGWTFDFVRNQIDELIALRKQLKAAANKTPDIPTGRYAIDSSTEDQDTAFYRVANADGNCKIWQYASATQHPVARTRVKGILQDIEKFGIEAARTRFGVELGYCWKCGLPLTNKKSRDLGIGPDCIKKI